MWNGQMQNTLDFSCLTSALGKYITASAKCEGWHYERDMGALAPSSGNFAPRRGMLSPQNFQINYCTFCVQSGNYWHLVAAIAQCTQLLQAPPNCSIFICRFYILFLCQTSLGLNALCTG